jgi:hypothetical protein
MSTRYEGAGARDVMVTIVKAGKEIGDDVVPEGQIALCFNYDEVFYLQGTPREVSELLTRAERAVESLIQVERSRERRTND